MNLTTHSMNLAIHCLSCIYPFKASARRTTYCSKECRQTWEKWDSIRRGGGVDTCPECGNAFHRKPRRVKNGKDLYCSRICAVRNMPRTWIEDALFDALRVLNVEFIEQEELLGKYIVDAYLPSYNLAIEAQGSYWHAKAATIASDNKKRTAFITNKINLLEIAEEEFRDQEWLETKINAVLIRIS